MRTTPRVSIPQSDGGDRRPRSERGFLPRAVEVLIYLQVILAPWLFGSTDPGEIRIVRLEAYLLGILCLFYFFANRRKKAFLLQSPSLARTEKFYRWTLATLTVLFFVYTGVSWLNARARFFQQELRFDYFENISWLPATYDKAETLFQLLNCLAHAAFFWSLWYWLRSGPPPTQSRGMPPRLKRLLWVMCISGGLLAVISLLQRLSGTNQLLWLIRPTINTTGDTQLGPFSYRSNGAQYFNLLWPACLALWYWRADGLDKHGKKKKMGGDPRILILPCVAMMAICPFVSASRGGAIVTVLEVFAAAAIIIARSWHDKLRAAIVTFWLFAALAIAAWLGWSGLEARMRQERFDTGRHEIYANARRMAGDYPIFGTGLGSFAAMYQLYRQDETQTWQALAHDDYLEFRATLGWAGLIMLLLSLFLVMSHWFVGSGASMPMEVVWLLLISMGGCLAHAKLDFPFQIYSIVSLFLVFCAVLFSHARNRRPPQLAAN